MYRLTAKIEIAGAKTWQLDFVTEVEITRDTEKLTDICKITLPKKIKWDGAAEIPVKRGDTVKVWLGYDGSNELAFVGYVKEVGFKTPVVLDCEDEMFKLKQMPAVKKTYKSVTVEQLLKDQGLTDVKVMGEQALGAYRVTADTVASLLGKLQEPVQPNSPGGTHFMAEVSRDFMERAGTKDTAALQKLLPFSTLALTTLKDRRGVFALIGKDEDRSQSLRRPSVRSKLQQASAEQKQPAAKKKDLEL
mgnify:CR=1 FL=1